MKTLKINWNLTASALLGVFPALLFSNSSSASVITLQSLLNHPHPPSLASPVAFIPPPLCVHHFPVLIQRPSILSVGNQSQLPSVFLLCLQQTQLHQLVVGFHLTNSRHLTMIRL